ncbi:MAG: aspartate/glutamate racemase family protein [Vicinamibacterales bacterium]
MPSPSHIIVTDSGLGGLSICALLEQGLRAAGPARGVRLTYVNAWPFESRGYNDLPDENERARVFDLALSRMAQMRPDRILIACNTLSILYPRTVFSRSPAAPVHGIVDAGVDAFSERLAGEPASSIALVGTKTTIESGEHRARLVERGVDEGRIAAVSCHGLAGAIERDVDGPRTAELIGDCAARAVAAAPPGGTLWLGLCCTHYGYVAGRLAEAAARLTARRVDWIDPNHRLAARLLADPRFIGDGARNGASAAPRGGSTPGTVSVELVSKVTLSEAARAGIARLVEPVSAATANALLSYAHVPDLF